YRSYGHPVRPVRVLKDKFITSIELNTTEIWLTPNKSTQLMATVLPWYATNKNVKWECSNKGVATVDQAGKVTAVAVGTCTITCLATDGSGVKAECQVTVLNGNSGTLDGHEYVDLGLPSGTLWATCNVGATSPEEYGDYFAWGETGPKSDYSWSTYKYCKGTEHSITKYCRDSYYGIVDYKTELEPSDDAAIVNWGSGWQMPSLEQCKELINSSYTTTTWTTLNGVKGKKITGKSNGNSIFLPAAGYRDDTSLYDAGSYGCYWSRSVNVGYGNSAFSLRFGGSSNSTYDYRRYYGRSVRPVRVNGVQTGVVLIIELSQTVLCVMVGETSQLSATVLPKNATNKNLKWESSNAEIATVDETGKVVAVAAGTCTITCSATDGSGVKAECQVGVVMNENQKFVDLGLPSGTLWATCNVGANSPEEYGNYFAWGETESKDYYDWSTYKYCKGFYDTMTKYCTDIYSGTVDNKTELEPFDDAATANWGSDWQMPSEEQLDELFSSSYTTTTWTTLNGKYGRKITSKSNDNSIFLPPAGCRVGTSLRNAGFTGYYWSRSLNTGYSYGYSAYYLHFGSSGIRVNYLYRYYGASVRPVRVKK
ncbi:MAG: Ig-like domain-containing protein, partial [Bacteroidaceae bacterium]|nr:Ig-like domain-containing protein [Bacteroidaceae bacterium]